MKSYIRLIFDAFINYFCEFGKSVVAAIYFLKRASNYNYAHNNTYNNVPITIPVPMEKIEAKCVTQWKLEVPVAEILNVSSPITQGFCSSTPLNQSAMSFPEVSLEESSSIHIRREESNNLHPDIDNASVPIFGRLKLLSMSKSLRKTESLKLLEGVETLKSPEFTADLATSTAISHITKSKSQIKKVISTKRRSITKRPRDEWKNRQLNQTITKATRTTFASEVKSQKGSVSYPIYSSNFHNFTKRTKPKSPKLLTAERAKMKRIREVKDKSLDRTITPRNRLRSKVEKSKQRKRICNSLATPDILKQFSRKKAGVRKIKVFEDDDHSSAVNLIHESSGAIPKSKPLGAVDKNIVPRHNCHYDSHSNLAQSSGKPFGLPFDQQCYCGENGEFKAHPVRKYKGLPMVAKRAITLPESPKLGKRRCVKGLHR